MQHHAVVAEQVLGVAAAGDFQHAVHQRRDFARVVLAVAGAQGRPRSIRCRPVARRASAGWPRPARAPLRACGSRCAGPESPISTSTSKRAPGPRGAAQSSISAELRQRVDQEPDPQAVVAAPAAGRAPSRSASQTTWLAMMARRAPASTPTASWKMVAKVRPQAPPAELLREQLGRHGGLAVRRAGDALALGRSPASRRCCAPAPSGGSRPAVGQVVGQHVPAVLADVGGAARRRSERIALLRWSRISSSVIFVPFGFVVPQGTRKIVAPAGVPVGRAAPSRSCMSAPARSVSSASGQRVRNTQPEGGFAGLGRSPCSSGTTRPLGRVGHRRCRPAAPRIGMLRAGVSSASVGAISITRPRYSTTTRSHRYSTTSRSCEMKSKREAELLASARPAGSPPGPGPRRRVPTAARRRR